LKEWKGEFKRGEYGVPTKTKFLWGKKPLYRKYLPPSPYQGEGGYRGMGLLNNLIK